MDADFVTERHFTPLLALKVAGKEVQERMLSSKLDLGYFERQTVESRVASVIRQLHANPRLRQTFCLNGDVSFENHANTLTDESDVVAGMSSLSLRQQQPRRSSRLASRVSDRTGPSATAPPAGSGGGVKPRPARPKADQFCVYNKGREEKVPAFIIEYKAPHKLSLSLIKAGLQDMELDQVVRYQEAETMEDLCRRSLAKIITQPFSYMIQSGVEFAYVCTGEAFIFLRVPRDNPTTVYYYLSVPKEDVGGATGWTGDYTADNRLHLTALGQVLALTLRALRVPPRDISWRNWAADKLKRWEMVYDDLLCDISDKDIPSSSYKPSTRARNEYCRASPVKTRSKSTRPGVAACNSPQGLLSSDSDEDSGDGFDPSTPSRRPRDPPLTSSSVSESVLAVAAMKPSRSHGASRQYCTQRCLRGLIGGGILDQECPNVLDHGIDRHQISTKTLLRLLDEQLSGNGGPDLELGCESLHIHGTRGALFKVTLWSHGYTFVGKGTPAEFIACLQHEESVYSRLTPVQGIHVPVLLGSLRLRRPFYYDGIAEMVHMMFMSYAGRTLAKRHEVDRDRLVLLAETSLQAIHGLGVIHDDPIPGNMTLENSRVMFIDFERAKLFPSRKPLGLLSPNHKRKGQQAKSLSPSLNYFERDKRRMRHELYS